MSTKAEEYRVRAAEYEKQAAAETDPELKAQFLDFARQWRELATVAETPAPKTDYP